MTEDNVCFIGSKEYGTYTKAIMTKVEKGPIYVKTRGKHIYNAVSICEFLSRTKDLKIESVKISSSTFKSDKDNKERIIPEIEILLKKK